MSTHIIDELDKKAEELGMNRSVIINMISKQWLDQQSALTSLPQLKEMMEQLQKGNREE